MFFTNKKVVYSSPTIKQLILFLAPLAQRLEQRTHNPLVGSSILSRGIRFTYIYVTFFYNRRILNMNKNVHHDKLKNNLSVFLNDSISNEEYSNRLDILYDFIDHIVDTMYYKQLYGSSRLSNILHNYIMYDNDYELKSNIILYFLEEFFTYNISIDIISSNFYNILENIVDTGNLVLSYNPSMFPMLTEYNKAYKRSLRG